VADILDVDVTAWERKERAAGYAESSIRTWRSTLHLILADAVAEKLRDSNPAARRRGRGKRAGRSRTRTPEKVVTTALGIVNRVFPVQGPSVAVAAVRRRATPTRS
jgi:hypothetical protein